MSYTINTNLMSLDAQVNASQSQNSLATAMQRLHNLPERPGPEEASCLMARFSPYRSLATMHLWTSLKETA